MTDAIELTRELISFDTVNPPGNEAELALFLGKMLQRAGFAVSAHEHAPGRLNLVARIGHGALPICFTGHLDTVPFGAAPWSVAPLGGEIVDGKLFGRGASDMKSGVAAAVAAAIDCASDLADGPGVMLIFTAGEETGCEGARSLVRETALEPAGALVVCEPTSNRPRFGHKGALWMVAETEGTAAHGAMPELGVNAIYRSARMVAKLEDYGFNVKRHRELGGPTLNVGTLNGGDTINSVPSRAEIGIDVRTLPRMAHGRLKSDLTRHLAPELDRLRTVVDLPAVWTDAADPWLRHVCKQLGVEIGKAEPFGLPFFTDASILKPALGNPPTLILGPGETEMAHKTDEYCFAHRIPEAVAHYRDLMLDWQARAAQDLARAV